MEKVKRSVVLAALLLLTTSMLTISNASFEPKIQGIPSIEDPSPGYWETSEYMITPNDIAVGIILPESNGTIDPSTEDWTDTEIQKVLSEIQYALDWWTSQNPDANVSFVTEVHARVPTSYEPINHPSTDSYLWSSEILTFLGYLGTRTLIQWMDYINDLRDRFNTDWCFAIMVVDSSSDSDGRFENGIFASSAPGGPRLMMTYDNGYWGIDKMDRMCAHEMGHIFWATDEYMAGTQYSGYLNASDTEDSGCLMDDCSWCLSEGTKAQVGWRDTDNDGIQDIVDTFPRVYFNSPEISGGRVNCTGVATVTPYPNNNTHTRNPDGPRNVTINKIKSIEYRIDSGEWIPANATDGAFGDPIENFVFITNPLEEGNHTVEIKATNQWGNEGFANTTIEVPEFLPTDLNQDGIVNILDITIVAVAWSPEGTTPEHPRWNPIADVDKNGIINIIDISKVARDYQKKLESTVSCTENGLEFSMSLKNTNIQIGDTADITLNLKNVSNESTTILFGTGQAFDLYLYQSGTTIARWSDGWYFTQLVWDVTLETGESFSQVLEWNFYIRDWEGNYSPPDPGKYRLTAMCVGRIEDSGISTMPTMQIELYTTA